ncbi:MAG: hypothetical protein ACKO4T_00075 [Planctomycetaceae bacterium]
MVGLVAALLFGVVATAEEWRTFLKAPETLFCTVTPVIAASDAEVAGVGEAQPAVPAGLPVPPDAVPAVDDTAQPAAVVEPVAAEEQAGTEPCGDENEDCRDALRKLRDDRLALIDLDIRVGGRPGNDYPCECRLEGETFEPRRFATTTFTWKAAGYCHKPLYFEDWQLERYGHSHGPLADPFFSAAHFFTTLPVLPYKMGVELPWECIYPLGYYRPGTCAPWTVPAIPISVRGMAVEAATVTGLVFLLP